jgi:hypothetical protein
MTTAGPMLSASNVITRTDMRGGPPANDDCAGAVTLTVFNILHTRRW